MGEHVCTRFSPDFFYSQDPETYVAISQQSDLDSATVALEALVHRVTSVSYHMSYPFTSDSRSVKTSQVSDLLYSSGTDYVDSMEAIDRQFQEIGFSKSCYCCSGYQEEKALRKTTVQNSKN